MLDIKLRAFLNNCGLSRESLGLVRGEAKMSARIKYMQRIGSQLHKQFLSRYREYKAQLY